jgi:hypothetical protein
VMEKSSNLRTVILSPSTMLSFSRALIPMTSQKDSAVVQWLVAAKRMTRIVKPITRQPRPVARRDAVERLKRMSLAIRFHLKMKPHLGLTTRRKNPLLRHANVAAPKTRHGKLYLTQPK